jgi:hypothetical protein
MLHLSSVEAVVAPKRVLISTDFPSIPVTNSDPDDVQSIVRFLLYSNEFDVEGLVASAGTFEMKAEMKNLLRVLDTYVQVEAPLKTIDPRYPTADYLRSVTFEGMGTNHDLNIKWGYDKQPWTDILGEGKDSEASEAIISAVDKPDPRPLYLCIWGGPREVAQALWRVQQTRSKEELNAFVSKMRIFLIGYQDASHRWLMENFPTLFIIESRTTYMGMFGVGSTSWVESNLLTGHGPLGALYPPRAIAGPGVIEGDSPSFLYLVSANRGINDPEDPTQPSWGGQYERIDSTNHFTDGPGKVSISKWGSDIQADFEKKLQRIKQ